MKCDRCPAPNLIMCKCYNPELDKSANFILKILKEHDELLKKCLKRNVAK